MLKAGRWWIRFPVRSYNFFQVTKSFQLHCGPGVYTSCNRNEYQKIFLGEKRSQFIRLKTLPPSVSHLSRKCGILDISQPFRPPWPVTGIALVYFLLFCLGRTPVHRRC
jgi:hypothetical protein